MRASEAISEFLFTNGIREVFGNPGTTELPFIETMKQRYILTLYDAIAVGAADGLSQIDRTPSLVNLHAAPGLGHSAGYIDTARRNRTPLIVTAGQQDTRHIEFEPLLFGDLVSMISSVTKYAIEVRRADEAVHAVRDAMIAAMTPPSGPVFVSLPMNLMEEDCPASDEVVDYEMAGHGDCTLVAEAINSSSSPAIVAGYEIDNFNAFEELAMFAEKLGAPVYAEPLCSRSPVGSSSLLAGNLLPATTAIDVTLAEYDTIILAGADFILYPYMPSPLLHGKNIIYVGSDPAVAHRISSSYLLGSIKRILSDLIPKIEKKQRTRFPKKDYSLANRIAKAAPVMGGEFVIDEVRRAFPRHTIVDESVSSSTLVRDLGFFRGKDSYFSSRSQQLGWGPAASIGIGMRRKDTILMVGDGSLMYAPQSLWTLKKYSIPVKVIVLNNHGYGILRSYSKAYHESLVGADLLSPDGTDFEMLARSFGIPADGVSVAQELHKKLAWIRDEEGPALLNVEMSREVLKIF
jgi:benzoylformate decarboxylase